MTNNLISNLFKTNAVRICQTDSPFWYTSNKIGPYYVNTHFLYGSEDKANDLLKKIDEARLQQDSCTEVIYKEVKANYESDAIYKDLIDNMVSFVKENIDLENIDYISGGERRDWFFSLMVADIIGKPHITIFKDMNLKVYDIAKNELIENSVIEGKSVLHIADIITEASSYVRAWIPAIKQAGGDLKYSLVVVDRLQGGKENLEANGVVSYALTNVDKHMFDTALEGGNISIEQYNMVSEFLVDPFNSMRNFLIAHPEFIDNSISAGGRNKDRAEKCIADDLYSLK